MEIYKFTVLTGIRFAKGDTIEEAFESMGYRGIPFEIKKSKVKTKGVVENKGLVECDGTTYSYEEVKEYKLSKREYIIEGYANQENINETHDHPIAALQAFLCLCIRREEMHKVNFFSRQWLTIDGQTEPIEVFWKYEKENL